MGKLVPKKKKSLSKYSDKLDLNIDDFTEMVLKEVRDNIDCRTDDDMVDPALIIKCQTRYHGVESHLRSEYRRSNVRYKIGVIEFEKKESEAFSFARKELPSKSTEKQIKLCAYETDDKLYDMRSEIEELEQKVKFLNGMITNAEKTLSAVQSLGNFIKAEREGSKI